METKKQIKKNGSNPIEDLGEYFVALEVSGTADLIQNNFSQKSIEDLLRKHMGFSVIKEPKIPSQCIERAKIMNTAGKICVPPVAFKSGMISASRGMKGLTMAALKGQIFVEGGSVPIEYEEMVPRMDMVRMSGMGRNPDVRFRPSFRNWSARMIIAFSPLLKVETVLELLTEAGKVGVGEWRKDKNGSFGTYKVTRNITDPKEIVEVRDLCASPLVSLKIPEWAMDAEISPEIMAKIARGEANDDE